jgi:hypothetical protein
MEVARERKTLVNGSLEIANNKVLIVLFGRDTSCNRIDEISIKILDAFARIIDNRVYNIIRHKGELLMSVPLQLASRRAA